MSVIKSYVKVPLILRIAIGLVLGAILGFIVKDVKIIMLLGSIFIGGLKALAPILIFILIIAD